MLLFKQSAPTARVAFGCHELGVRGSQILELGNHCSFAGNLGLGCLTEPEVHLPDPIDVLGVGVDDVAHFVRRHRWRHGRQALPAQLVGGARLLQLGVKERVLQEAMLGRIFVQAIEMRCQSGEFTLDLVACDLFDRQAGIEAALSGEIFVDRDAAFFIGAAQLGDVYCSCGGLVNPIAEPVVRGNLLDDIDKPLAFADRRRDKAGRHHGRGDNRRRCHGGCLEVAPFVILHEQGRSQCGRAGAEHQSQAVLQPSRKCRSGS